MNKFLFAAALIVSGLLVGFDILHALKDVDSCYVQAVA